MKISFVFPLNGFCLSFGDERLLSFFFLEKESDGDEVHCSLSGEVSRAVQHVIIMSTEAGPWDTLVTDDFLYSQCLNLRHVSMEGKSLLHGLASYDHH